MKLDPKVLEVFQEKLSKMPHKCSICGYDKFGINDIETQILGYSREGENIINDLNINHIPVITTHCLHCGHIDQFAISIVMNSPVK